MKILLLLALIAGGIYLLGPDMVESIWAKPERSAAASPDAGHRVRIFRDDLVPIAGRVVAIERGAITINCPAPVLPRQPNFTGPMWQLSASDGNGASKSLAKLAAAEEAKYRAALKAASVKVSGVVVLYAHPQQRELRAGMPVSVTAAPLGDRSYTMDYEIAPDPSGSWMWKSRSNPLEQP